MPEQAQVQVERRNRAHKHLLSVIALSQHGGVPATDQEAQLARTLARTLEAEGLLTPQALEVEP